MANHPCKTAVLFCMDYRFNDHFRKFLVDRGLIRDGVDVVRLAGAAKLLGHFSTEAERIFVLNQLRTSKVLHGIREIHLVNHEDCGSYGPELVPTRPRSSRPTAAISATLASC